MIFSDIYLNKDEVHVLIKFIVLSNYYRGLKLALLVLRMLGSTYE